MWIQVCTIHGSQAHTIEVMCCKATIEELREHRPKPRSQHCYWYHCQLGMNVLQYEKQKTKITYHLRNTSLGLANGGCRGGQKYRRVVSLTTANGMCEAAKKRTTVIKKGRGKMVVGYETGHIGNTMIANIISWTYQDGHDGHCKHDLMIQCLLAGMQAAAHKARMHQKVALETQALVAALRPAISHGSQHTRGPQKTEEYNAFTYMYFNNILHIKKKMMEAIEDTNISQAFTEKLKRAPTDGLIGYKIPEDYVQIDNIFIEKP
ncbi:hypothetical protein EI555_006425, partial [Monodon monoceros]